MVGGFYVATLFLEITSWLGFSTHNELSPWSVYILKQAPDNLVYICPC